MSIETEQYLRLKNRIYSDLSTKIFSINHWEKLKEIPQEIKLLQELEHLSVYRNKSLKKYPEELAELPNLRFLSLRFNNLKQLPPVLAQLSALETLVLSNNRFLSATKWNYLTNLQTLQVLDLSYSLQNLSILPKAIGQLSQLKELNIAGNKLKSLPPEFKNLTALEKLHCEVNDFEDFPIIITKLSKLKELQIPAKSLQKLPDEALELQHIERLKFTAKNNKRTPYIFPFERLLKNIKTYRFNRAHQLFFLNIIRGSVSIQELSNQKLLILLNCAIPSYINQALIEINARIQNNCFGNFRLPVSGDKIIIKGKLKGKVSELKKRLAENSIQTGVKINASTTHILIGSMPGDVYSMIEDQNIVVLTEQSLVSYLNQVNQPYLLAQSEHANLENIRQLLHSEQNDNILLALEMLKGGGCPLELLTELFLIYKFSRVQKTKRMIYQIVGQCAPLTFVTALKSRKPIGPGLSEMTRCHNLEYYCTAGNLDKKYIAFYLLKKGKYGHLFALFNLSTRDKREYFDQALQEGHLSLSGLDLTNLPDDLGKISGLVHLDISYNKFTRVPPQLFDCKELQSLHIRGLYDIHKKPQDLWEIPALDTIYVGYNNKWIGHTNSNSMTIKGKKIIGR